MHGNWKKEEINPNVNNINASIRSFKSTQTKDRSKQKKGRVNIKKSIKTTNGSTTQWHIRKI